jgi:hypothetical protein
VRPRDGGTRLGWLDEEATDGGVRLVDRLQTVVEVLKGDLSGRGMTAADVSLAWPDPPTPFKWRVPGEGVVRGWLAMLESDDCGCCVYKVAGDRYKPL